MATVLLVEDESLVLNSLLQLFAALAPEPGEEATLDAQRRLSGALLSTRNSLRTLVRSSVDPVVILDDSLSVTLASEAAGEVLGLGAPAPGLDARHR